MKQILIFLLAVFIPTSFVFAGDPLPDLKIKQLDDGVYLHTSFQVFSGVVMGSNGLVVLDHNDAYIVDTPWSAEDTEKLLSWIKANGFSVKGSISTHSHDDRTAGIALLNSKAIPTYASKMTNGFLEKAGKAQAKNSFDSKDFWWVKDQVEVFYPGAGHAPDNLVVWLPKQKILFGGCLIRAKEAKNLGNVADAVIGEWPRSAEKLQEKYGNAKVVVPGHGEVGDVSLLEHTKELAAASARK
uniref:subclass B1 metallo-beta-lactamase GRD23-1 n=1 Tax=uncultured bacterium TaxID=77133 RepID=UPI000949C03B|nr:subclass B1 metallo-beta-lactamase GRD23-1 [uncultured bacterium]APR64493.1 carbapenem-hydrolyzing metallo-beta-lactamase GRD23-1 [uncultured bacterium]